MFKLKTISAILNINMACLLFLAPLAHTEDRYLIDTVTTSLHEGPGSQYRVLQSLPSDQSFEVLETSNNFIRIRTKDGVEGWVQENVTHTRAPEVSNAKDSDEKVDALAPKSKEKTLSNSARLAVKAPDPALDFQPRKEFTEQPSAKESMEIKKLQAELSELTKQFNQAEAAAADAEQIKIEYENLKAEASTMQNTIAGLQQSNISLASKNDFYWFFAGSAVFFLGWLVGRISFRRQRHSSLTL